MEQVQHSVGPPAQATVRCMSYRAKLLGNRAVCGLVSTTTRVNRGLQHNIADNLRAGSCPSAHNDRESHRPRPWTLSSSRELPQEAPSTRDQSKWKEQQLGEKGHNATSEKSDARPRAQRCQLPPSHTHWAGQVEQ